MMKSQTAVASKIRKSQQLKEGISLGEVFIYSASFSDGGV